MMVVRPVAFEDCAAIARLAALADFGLTTLPKDEGALAKRVTRSVADFEANSDTPEGESYLFVLDDTNGKTGDIVGTSGLVSRVGGFEPFYTFRIEEVVHESSALNVKKEIGALHLVEQHDGPCEIATLFLGPKHRGSGLGRLLSKARFLFLASYRRAFADSVIAELRGVVDGCGHSPFWESVGRHFFEVDFPRADYLSASDKKFIAELMPRHPIYIPLLPTEGQAAIGEVHERTRPALKILEAEGFTFTGMVDIFDAGPIVACPLEEIRTVKASCEALVDKIAAGDMRPDPPTHIIARTPDEYTQFRASAGWVERLGEESVCLDESCAKAIRVEVGDPVRFAPARL